MKVKRSNRFMFTVLGLNMFNIIFTIWSLANTVDITQCKNFDQIS